MKYAVESITVVMSELYKHYKYSEYYRVLFKTTTSHWTNMLYNLMYNSQLK